MGIEQCLGKLIGVSAKNGIRVFEQFGKRGERILTSYKPGADMPFKKVKLSKNYTRDAYQRTSNLHRRDVEQLNAYVEQTGKNPIEIDTYTDHWFYNGAPTCSYTRALKIQNGVADRSVNRNIYHLDQTCKHNNIAVFDGNNMVNFKYI